MHSLSDRHKYLAPIQGERIFYLPEPGVFLQYRFVRRVALSYSRGPHLYFTTQKLHKCQADMIHRALHVTLQVHRLKEREDKVK